MKMVAADAARPGKREVRIPLAREFRGFERFAEPAAGIGRAAQDSDHDRIRRGRAHAGGSLNFGD
jgi:hypothetical protein